MAKPKPDQPDHQARATLLTGLRVAESGTFIAVPFAGRLLCKLGATVYKVADLDDPARRITRPTGPSLYDCLNDGKTFVGSLADNEADLLLTDVRAQESAQAKLTVALRTLPFDCPPYADAALLSALSCASWAIGDPQRQPLAMPAEASAFIVGAILAGAATLRLAGGSIGYSEVDGLLGLSSFVEQNSTSYRLSGIGWRREGRRAAGSAGIYPYGIYSCRDGQVALIARSRRDWEHIARAVGADDVLAAFPDPFEIAAHHADEADRMLCPHLLTCTKTEVLARAESDGVLAVPVASLEDVLAYENLYTERGFWDVIDSAVFPALPFLATLAGGTA